MAKRFGNGVHIIRTSGLTSWTGNAFIVVVFRQNSYGGTFEQVMNLHASAGDLGIDADEVDPDRQAAYAYNGTLDARNVIPASDTDWVAAVLSHDGTTDEYHLHTLRPGESSMTHVTSGGPIDVGLEMDFTELAIGDRFGSVADCDVHLCIMDGRLPTTSDMLDMITNASYDGSGDDVWLRFQTGVGAGTNGGTAGAFTVNNGPPSDVAAAPNWSSGTTGTAALVPAAATLAVAGGPIISGTAALTPSATTLAAAGAPVIHGTAALVPAAATLLVTQDGTITGTAALVPAAATLSVAGAPVISGTAALAPAAASLLTAGQPIIAGAAALASAAATLAVAGGARGPLIQPHADGRHLKNANDSDAFWRAKGDSNWTIHLEIAPTPKATFPSDGFAASLEAGWDTYFTAMAAKGFNFVPIQLLSRYNSAYPENSNGDEPFTGADWTTPNDDYFQVARDLIIKAASYGFVVPIFPAWGGYDTNQGFAARLVAATNGNVQTYGAYLANFFGDLDNIMWGMGGDVPATVSATLVARYAAMVVGIRSVDTRHIITGHWNFAPSDNPAVTDAQDLTSCYFWLNSGTAVDAQVEDEYGEDDAPVMMLEADYEDKSGISGYIVRQSTISSFLNGAFAGTCSGGEGRWHNGGGQPTSQPNLPSQSVNIPYDLDSPGLNHMAAFHAILDARRWYELVPEFASSDLITAGRGTHDNYEYVTAARDATSNTTLAIIYVTKGTSITVDMTEFAGPVTARWYDPTDVGVFEPATGSPIAASGTHNFVASSEVGTNSEGDADWILVLETEANFAALAPAAATMSAAGGPVIHGTAALVNAAAGLSAAGGGVVHGTASLAPAPAQLAAAGAPLITGTAAMAPAPAQLAVVGAPLIAGTAALVAGAATLSAVGEGVVADAAVGVGDRDYPDHSRLGPHMARPGHYPPG